jgi:hypothetical protein
VGSREWRVGEEEEKKGARKQVGIIGELLKLADLGVYICGIGSTQENFRWISDWRGRLGDWSKLGWINSYGGADQSPDVLF